MTSSDFEPWLLRSAFPAEPWFSDAFSRDTDALTKALTHSLSTPSEDDSLFDLLNSPTPTPPSLSVSGSASDPDTSSKKIPRRSAPGPASGRAGKRKSRASKKSPTTFITADAENFRQMVQQVTGVQFSAVASGGVLGSILKPDPQRLAAAAAFGGRIQGCLPTLDTSAFLLDHHQEVVGHGGAVGAQSAAAAAFAAPTSGSGGDGAGVGGAVGGVDFGSFSCFPTLDSWEVM